MTDNKIETSSDNVVYFSRLHWVIFVAPVLGVLVCLVLAEIFPLVQRISLLLALFALLWVGMTWVTYYFSSLSIQKKRVILRTGVLVRQTVDIPLTKIETIDIRQSILGSVLGYGMLIITGTGGTRHFVTFLQKPLTCRRYIEQLMNDEI